ncbi:TVP38/TMEM64 family protein [Halobellus rarus]|uniref:TVP38/TMEM64 family protein n=1 Tax=Halobellus rarus TaxID=1126237 RepID=A0ABD6CIU7_9EURY|nr:TVP38/TMEM64 family protein [Halobellus rarus]
MRLFSSRADRWRGILILLLVSVAFFGLYLATRRYASFIFDAAELRAWIAQFGIFAPLVFVFVQALQVVVAPIPGQVVALVAGYLFGPFWGTVYSLTGVLIGSAVAFSLAKRYGRSFVEDILHEDVVNRFDEFVERVGAPGLFAFVIIPGLPDDAICFLSGLTPLRLRTFIAVISIGRLPAYVITVYAGGELASGRFLEGIALVAAVIALSAIGYFKQEAVRDLVRRLELRFQL